MAVHALTTVRKRAHPLDLRQKLESEIERLIAMLDTLDGDPDLEEDADDEPSIGGGMFGYPVDIELDDCDKEPSLGWTASEAGLGVYAGTAEVDAEQDDEGEDDFRHLPAELPRDQLPMGYAPW